MAINPVSSNQAAFSQDASVQILKKVLDVQKLQGEAAIKLVEQANIQDDIANKIDVFA